MIEFFHQVHRIVNEYNVDEIRKADDDASNECEDFFRTMQVDLYDAKIHYVILRNLYPKFLQFLCREKECASQRADCKSAKQPREVSMKHFGLGVNKRLEKTQYDVADDYGKQSHIINHRDRIGIGRRQMSSGIARIDAVINPGEQKDARKDKQRILPFDGAFFALSTEREYRKQCDDDIENDGKGIARCARQGEFAQNIGNLLQWKGKPAIGIEQLEAKQRKEQTDNGFNQ